MTSLQTIQTSLPPGAQAAAVARAPTRLMIVDDDPIHTLILCHQLRSRGYQCTPCHNSADMARHLESGQLPDVCILDFHLGEDEVCGLDLCRQLRAYLDRPVIMLSGDDTVDTKVSCLNGGADQYIVKPCDLNELVARIEVVVRNQQRLSMLQQAASGNQDSIRIALDADCALDWGSRSLICGNGTRISLTEKESALLELFLCQTPRILNRYQAFHSLYGFEMDPTNRSIDILISRLRRKLSKANPGFSIRTLRGEGYELTLPH